MPISTGLLLNQFFGTGLSGNGRLFKEITALKRRDQEATRQARRDHLILVDRDLNTKAAQGAKS